MSCCCCSNMFEVNVLLLLSSFVPWSAILRPKPVAPLENGGIDPREVRACLEASHTLLSHMYCRYRVTHPPLKKKKY